MSKRERKLWIRIEGTVPAGVSKRQFASILFDSVTAGERSGYKLPEGFRATIYWRNRRGVPDRSGEWTQELLASASGPTGSQGFELAVIRYLQPKAAASIRAATPTEESLLEEEE